MRVVTFAGAHACGKTAVIMKAVQNLKEQGIHAAVMKLDCISSEDDKIYERAGIPTVKYLSGNTCPDHFFVQSIEQAYAWARERGADMLVTESAGLCGRCSPHIRDIPAVCVIDCLSGISAPFKIGPMLWYADYVVITKGDLVSPTEREIFLYNVKKANRKARVFFVNGLKGQGIYKLDQILQTTGEIQAITDKYLRSAYFSLRFLRLMSLPRHRSQRKYHTHHFPRRALPQYLRHPPSHQGFSPLLCQS